MPETHLAVRVAASLAGTVVNIKEYALISNKEFNILCKSSVGKRHRICKLLFGKESFMECHCLSILDLFFLVLYPKVPVKKTHAWHNS